MIFKIIHNIKPSEILVFLLHRLHLVIICGYVRVLNSVSRNFLLISSIPEFYSSECKDYEKVCFVLISGSHVLAHPTPSLI